MAPLKYLNIFWRTVEMLLISCEISPMLAWSKNCFLVVGTAANQELAFTIIDTKPYVLVVTLSIQDNVKLLKQWESGFKRIINGNKYQSEVTQQTLSRNSDFLIEQSFQGVNRLFLSFEDSRVQESFLLVLEIKDYNVKDYDRKKKFLWSTSEKWFKNMW